MSELVVTQVKSTIGQCKKNKAIVLGMGFRKLNQTRVFKDNNCIRGMINKVSHLVEYKLKD